MPAKVSIQIEAPSGTLLRVEGRKVRPNVPFTETPGTIRVDYRCPGGRRALRGRKTYTVPEAPEGTVEFKLNCRMKSHR